MPSIFRSCCALPWLFAATTASASFHTFQIEQLFSNADGSVQFCVLHEASGADGQEFWAGHSFTSTHAGVTHTLVFPRNLPAAATHGRRVLVATQGFSDLALVAPDFVVANGFFATDGAAVNFAGVDQVTYSALPGDGIHAIDRNGAIVQNLATNFGGQSAAVAAPAAARNFQGLWWNSPAGSESGWGINFAHQGDIIFATWFTYDAARQPWWLIAQLDKTAGGAYAGPVSTVAGPPFDAVPFPPGGSPGGAVETLVGTMTATFSDATHGAIQYTVNGVTQAKAIVPQVFGTLPTCTWGAEPNLALATNYTDLWWNAGESGWGVNFTHQGDVIFATWFTYDAAGKPWWLIALLEKTAGGAYAGPVSTVAGPPFNAEPFPPGGSAGGAIETQVGDASVSFADGNAATFAYRVNAIAQSRTITRQVFVAPGTVCR